MSIVTDPEVVQDGRSAASASLRALVVRHAAEILGNVAIGGESHLELAAVGQYLEADYHGRFLVELLQNASDQAVKGGVLRPVVTIVRGEGFLAVANQGEPFDERGLRSITSLGLSAKEPSELIGNKGIGFKAVFEVCRSPEIFSASSRSTTFASEGSIAFRLSATPFEGPEGVALLHFLVEAAFAARPEDKARLGTESRAVLATAIQQAAPFRFPVELEASSARLRLAQVDGLINDAQTLVVLPLTASPDAEKTVASALDELSSANGAMILFLAGVAELRIFDQTRNRRVVITKERSALPAVASDPARRALVVTSASLAGQSVSSTVWQVVESTYGGSERPQDANELNVAARKLPGKKWDGVESVPVSIALPMPGEEAADLGVGTSGFICIGLPTKNPTGTRAWINSHFFGTISRKEVDLRTCDFNKLLFAEAVRLHDVLIQQLQSGSLAERRLATLAFDPLEGPLRTALFAANGSAAGPIVLAEDGATFLRVGDVLVVDPQDIEIAVKILSASAGTMHTARLPDVFLAARAAVLFRRLIPTSGQDSVVTMMFAVAPDGLCAIERAAQRFRAEGPTFWEPFLDFCLRLDPGMTRLRDLRLFPVSTDRLATSSSGVFLPPATEELDASDSDPDERNERGMMAALPATVISRLNLLDISCIRTRQPGSRKLTDLAARLSRDPGPLVKRPRYEELVNGALAPALEALGTSSRDLFDGLQLLRLAGQWMLDMGDEARTRVAGARLRVPVLCSGEPGWIWAVPRECYFGAGWLDGRAEELLSIAYGRRDRTVLLSWARISSVLGDVDRHTWFRMFAAVGVNARPRLLSPARPPAAQFEALSYAQLTIRAGAQCPIPTASPFWEGYLKWCRQRSVQVASRQTYAFHRVTWVDGLEDEQARAAVVELVLRDSRPYEADLRTVLARAENAWDPSVVPSLWIHAIASNDWSVVPAGGATSRPSECWFTAGVRDTTRQGRFDFLTIVEPDFRDASRVLLAMGVPELENPPVRAILYELQRIARRVKANPSAGNRHLVNLAEDLYGRLQQSLRDDLAEGLHGIELLPLLRDGVLVDAPLREISEAWHQDDPGRGAYIPGMTGKLTWPFSPRARVARLVGWLRKHLGPRGVLLTSEAEVDTGFVPVAPSVSLFDWIRANFPAWQQVMTDLGCLIAYTGSRETDPSKEQFHEHWSKFRGAVVVLGRFAEDVATVFVDARPGLPATIQASVGLLPCDILCETWRLVGQSYEDSWRLYHHALRQNADTAFQFLRRKKITEKERDDIDAQIGLAPADRLERLKAFVLAMRLGRHAETRGSFERAWRENVVPLSRFVVWAGPPFTEKLVNDVVFLPSEEAAFVQLLHQTRTEEGTWQTARVMLGQLRYRFATTAALWDSTVAQIAAVLRVAFARLPGSDLQALGPTMNALSGMPIPDQIAETSPDFSRVLVAAIAAASDHCAALEARAASVAGNRLTAMAGTAAKAPEDIRLSEGVPDRDVREYRDVSEEGRSQLATDRYELYADVACAVAAATGEVVDRVALDASPNISALLRGPWANRFCVIAALQHELRRQAPRTAELLGERGAFKQDYAPHELRALFTDLLREVAPPPVPEPSINLLGNDVSPSDISREIRAVGVVGASIAAAAEPTAWDVNFATAARLSLETRTGASGSAGGRVSRTPRESDEDKALNGKLGEIFVYEVLRKMGLPAFDAAQCWLSTNRCEYTGYPDGFDDAGCDFRVRDEDGRLTGRDDKPWCLLEVKSSSGAADGPFRISENEWRRATEAHFAGEVYLIVRVADVRGTPRIVDIIRDPYELLAARQLRFWGGDLNAEVAPRA